MEIKFPNKEIKINFQSNMYIYKVQRKLNDITNSAIYAEIYK